MTRRVVVTGVGLVSPLGHRHRSRPGQAPAGRPLRRRARSPSSTPRQHSTQFAAEVKGFDPLGWVDKKDVKKMDRFIQFAVAAADFAVKDAGLAASGPRMPNGSGVYIGSGIGGFATIEREHETLMKGGPRKVSPFFIPAAIANLASGWVSIRTGAKGPNSCTCTACTSSAHAVGDSFRLIQRGDADAMIAGGSEAAITPLAVGGFCSMRALSTRNDAPEKASRPFDKDRDGFVIGEGAGILVLEELERAQARGAQIYCEVVGYGMSGDAFHISAPCEDGDGAMRVMRATLKDARGRASSGRLRQLPRHLDAGGRPHRGAGDQGGLRRTRPSKLAISSTKSMTGHLLGAAGGLEAGITALALRDQVLPADHQPREPGPRLRPRLRAQREARKADVELRPLQLLRLRGHERGAAVPLLRRLASPRPRPPFLSDIPQPGKRLHEDRRLRQAGPRHRDPHPHRSGGQRPSSRRTSTGSSRPTTSSRSRRRCASARSKGGEVVLVSLGPDRVQTALRNGLAMGADSAAAPQGPALRRGRHRWERRAPSRPRSRASPRSTSCSPASRAWAATTARSRASWPSCSTCPR